MGILASIIYGLISIIGGIVGYIQAESKVSLISGTISGILMLFFSYWMNRGFEWAFLIANIITFMLILVFSLRLKKTGKFMPAGLMVILGVITFIFITSQYLSLE